MNNIIIFDVCNTLFDSNTTFDFIQFVLKRKRNYRRLAILKALTLRYSPVFIFLTILGKLKGKDMIRRQAVHLLHGLGRRELLQWAHEFYEQHLVYKKMSDVLQMLDEARSRGDVWLFSNSLEPVIEVIAEKLKVHFAASELEYDASLKFTGRIKNDLHGKKLESFHHRFGTGSIITLMCTDNKSDKAILNYAEKRYVVVYREADKKFWKDLNPVFIEKY